jgi:hypothetical protein
MRREIQAFGAHTEALKLAIAEGFEGPFLDGPSAMAELKERIRARI